MSSSLGRIGAIARTTFIELARLRVFYVLVLFALVLIISSSFLARISFQQELQVTKDIALGAINFFLSMLAIVATAQLLPRDLEDRVIYSVLAKPVRRFEYMLGKFFGVLGLLVISLVAMSILCLAVIHLREGAAVRETMQQLAQSPSEELDHALVGVHQAGVNRDFLAAVVFFFPDLQAFNLSDQIVAGSSLSNLMLLKLLGLGVIYIVGYLVIAIAIFSQREL